MEFYHDFSALGFKTKQRPGIYGPNQEAKAPILTGYLLFAIGKLRSTGVTPTVAELYCADAYYSFLAERFGAARCDAFDNDRDHHMAEARAAKEALASTKVQLHNTDVMDISKEFRADIVINAGGLYHVADPIAHLKRSYEMAKHYLIVQTVVSMANESEDYFEAPAPGWTWGSRASRTFISKAVGALGGHILDQAFNELTGNARLEDRGSVYFLVARR